MKELDLRFSFVLLYLDWTNNRFDRMFTISRFWQQCRLRFSFFANDVSFSGCSFLNHAEKEIG